MATQKEMDLFEEKILTAIGTTAENRENEEWANEIIDGFLAMQGNCYNGDLMVVGRAVNGWRCHTSPLGLATQAFRREYALNVLNSVSGDQGQCPMNWVTQRNMTGSSAFWRVIRMVIGGLSSQTLTKNKWPPHLRKCWPSHIVWSNLYKLAPRGGGNPNGQLRAIQRVGCIDLLQLEIKTYRPRQLLFITGGRWGQINRFLDALSAVSLNGSNQYVRRIGRLALPETGQTNFVVACRPERRPERYWATEVINAFQWLEKANPWPPQYFF